MKKKYKVIKSNDDYNYEGMEDLTKNESKQELIIQNKFTYGFDDLFQKINMLHKDYQNRSFLNDFSSFDNIFKEYFCGLRKTDNKNRRN